MKFYLVRRLAVTETLRRMEVGESAEVERKHAKATTVRAAANRLKKSLDMEFLCSEKGRTTNVLVTRIK